MATGRGDGSHARLEANLPSSLRGDHRAARGAPSGRRAIFTTHRREAKVDRPARLGPRRAARAAVPARVLVGAYSARGPPRDARAEFWIYQCPGAKRADLVG